MTRQTCRHTTTRTIRERPFFGAVSRHQNPAAHGGITITEECVRCGARRESNVNGLHAEDGDWYSADED